MAKAFGLNPRIVAWLQWKPFVIAIYLLIWLTMAESELDRYGERPDIALPMSTLKESLEWAFRLHHNIPSNNPCVPVHKNEPLELFSILLYW